jgi:hypothetical protein
VKFPDHEEIAPETQSAEYETIQKVENSMQNRPLCVGFEPLIESESPASYRIAKYKLNYRNLKNRKQLNEAVIKKQSRRERTKQDW